MFSDSNLVFLSAQSELFAYCPLYYNIHECEVTFNPSLAEHDMPCLSKQRRSRSVGF